MSKKELRKELELLLVRSIENVLNQKNATTAKSIRKNTLGASKTIAKKFYKSLKTETKSVAKPAPRKSTKAIKSTVKKSAKPAIKKTTSSIKRTSAKAKK